MFLNIKFNNYFMLFLSEKFYVSGDDTKEMYGVNCKKCLNYTLDRTFLFIFFFGKNSLRQPALRKRDIRLLSYLRGHNVMRAFNSTDSCIHFNGMGLLSKWITDFFCNRCLTV